jgi:hypothetical protein
MGRDAEKISAGETDRDGGVSSRELFDRRDVRDFVDVHDQAARSVSTILRQAGFEFKLGSLVF